MNNRDTLLSVQFPPATSTEPFLELDLRDIYTNVLLGRRGQLQVMTKLVFRASDDYRKDQSVFRIWADVRVQGQDGVPWSLGRAAIPEPVFFGPPSADSFAPAHFDPWTRAVDRLTLDLDHRQLEEIEQKRRGGPLIFTFLVDGTVQCGSRIGRLYAANNQLTYDLSESEWIRLLSQLGYGSYVTIEVPLTSPNGLTGTVQQAAHALQEAQAAFLRGDYEEAVADCRPGLEAQWPCFKVSSGIVTVSWRMMVLKGSLRTAGCRTGSRSVFWPGFSRRSWWMRRWMRPGPGSSGAGCCRRGW